MRLELLTRLRALLSSEQLPVAFESTVVSVYAPLARALAGRVRKSQPRRPIVVGISGPQGSGKTTLVKFLAVLLEEHGVRTAVVSLDDFYRTRRERGELAVQVHPLLVTRGVPGTHDLALANHVFDALGRPGSVALPAFDKARDDRRREATWQSITTPLDIVLFEGWCVGARPQPSSALVVPVNALERDRDPSGIWRRYVNDVLATDYQALFERLDALVMLVPPSFDVVAEWRIEQEHKLRARLDAEQRETTHVMSDARVRDFVAHYERLTLHMLEEMPGRADYVIQLDAARGVTSCGFLAP